MPKYLISNLYLTFSVTILQENINGCGEKSHHFGGALALKSGLCVLVLAFKMLFFLHLKTGTSGKTNAGILDLSGPTVQ